MNPTGTFLRLLPLLFGCLVFCAAAVFVIGIHSPIGTFRSLEKSPANARQTGMNAARPGVVRVMEQPLPSKSKLHPDETKILEVNVAGTVKVNQFG